MNYRTGDCNDHNDDGNGVFFYQQNLIMVMKVNSKIMRMKFLNRVWMVIMMMMMMIDDAQQNCGDDIFKPDVNGDNDNDDYDEQQNHDDILKPDVDGDNDNDDDDW